MFTLIVMLLVQIQIRFLSNSDVIALYLAAVPWLLSMSVSTYTEMSVAALYCQVCSALLTFLLQHCSCCGHTAHWPAHTTHTCLPINRVCLKILWIIFFRQRRYLCFQIFGFGYVLMCCLAKILLDVDTCVTHILRHPAHSDGCL